VPGNAENAPSPFYRGVFNSRTPLALASSNEGCCCTGPSHPITFRLDQSAGPVPLSQRTKAVATVSVTPGLLASSGIPRELQVERLDQFGWAATTDSPACAIGAVVQGAAPGEVPSRSQVVANPHGRPPRVEGRLQRSQLLDRSGPRCPGRRRYLRQPSYRRCRRTRWTGRRRRRRRSTAAAC